MEHNPYESPQTIRLSGPRSVNLARDTQDVISASHLMLLYTALGIGILAIQFFTWFLQIEQLWVWLHWVLAIAATAGAVLQAWALLLMRRVPRESRAKGCLGISLLALILSIGFYWSSLGLMFYWRDFRWLLGGYFFSSAIGWLGQLALLLAFGCIGQYYSVARLRMYALISFIFLFLYHGWMLFRMGWMMLNVAPAKAYEHLAANSITLADPIQAVCTISYTILFVLALRSFKLITPVADEDLLTASE